MKAAIVLRFIILFVFLVLVQVLILNNVQLGGYINPYVYLVFILLLPVDVAGWLLLGSSFALGLTIDMFLDSMGMHAAASVLLAFCRPAIVRLITIRSDFEPGTIPTISNRGLNWIMTYSFLLILIHHFALFFLEIFRFAEFWSTLYRIILSTLFTFVFVVLGYFIIGRTTRY